MIVLFFFFDQEELEKKLQEAREAEEFAKKQQKKPKFQHIYMSCPDGLAIRFELDPSSFGKDIAIFSLLCILFMFCILLPELLFLDNSMLYRSWR